MENPWQEADRGGRLPALLALGGVLVAGLALALAGAAGPPYLGAGGVNGWIVVFAAGLLAALVSFPFAAELRLRGRQPDRDRRWELALVAWAGLAAALLAAALAVGVGTSTLAGAAALIATVEAAIVIATIVAWLLAGG